MKKLLTSSLTEAMVILKASGFEEDKSYRFFRLDEDYSQAEARVFKTANGGYSIHFLPEEDLDEHICP